MLSSDELLQLSGPEIKQGSSFDDIMTEDYLNLSQKVSDVVDSVNANTSQLIKETGSVLASGENQRIVMRNVAPETVTLPTEARVNSVLEVKRRGSTVTIIGTVDGVVNPVLPVLNDKIRILYDGVEYVEL